MKTATTDRPTLSDHLDPGTFRSFVRGLIMLCVVGFVPYGASAQLERTFSFHVDGLVDHRASKLVSDALIKLDPSADLILDIVAAEVTMRSMRSITLSDLELVLSPHSFTPSSLVLLGADPSKPDHLISEADVRKALDMPEGHAIDGAEYARIKRAWIANDPEGYRNALFRSGLQGTNLHEK